MENELIIGSLIGAISVILGAIIGITGQILGNWINHRNNIKFLIFDTFFKQKLSFLDRLGSGLEKSILKESQIAALIVSIRLDKKNKSKIKKLLIKLLLDKNNLDEFKPSGKGIYISDKSPVINLLKTYILTYTTNMLLLRKLIDSNINNQETSDMLIKNIRENFINGNNLLASIKKEMLSKTELK